MSTQRRTGAALLLSTAAHAALLGALLLTVRLHPALHPLQVRLLELPAVQKAEGLDKDEAARAAAAAPSLLAAKPRPALASAREVQPAQVAPGPRTSPAVPAAVLSGQGEAASPAAPDETGAVGAGGLGLPASAWPSGSGTGGGGAAGGVRAAELHRRLAEAAARCYPASARRFRLTGEVPLHFCLDARGTASAVSLQGSTGSALLDASALECVVPGAQPLTGFEGCFLVPVRFGG